MTAPFQIFGSLPSHIEAAMRSSIKRFGVLVPVAIDQQGRVIDGHHRSRIANELGVECPTTTLTVASDDDAREIARTLNADRRQLSEEERKKVVADLRQEGHSVRAIAGALGVGKSTVHEDLDELSAAGQLTEPKQVKGLDGRSRPAESRKPKKHKSEKPKVIATDPKFERLYEEVKSELVAAKEQLERQQEALDELADTDKSVQAFKDDEQFKEMQVLREELRAVKRRRDELMRENAELKRMVSYWKKKAEKK